MDVNQVKSMLKSFGLTEYEVKAYLTLLRLGISTAEKLSEIGNIPLPRVYDTMEELQRKGFILVGKSRPKKFKPISPEKSLNNLIKIKKKEFELKISDLKKDGKIAVKSLLKIRPLETKKEKWTIWSTEKRKNIQRILDEQEKLAKKEILIFAGDMSWLPERINNIKEAIKRGVKIRIIMREPYDSEDMTRYIKNIKKMGVIIKTGHDSLIRGEIIDNKNALIAIKTQKKKTEVDFKPSYELMIFENPVMVNVFKENFDFWWKNLKS